MLTLVDVCAHATICVDTRQPLLLVLMLLSCVMLVLVQHTYIPFVIEREKEREKERQYRAAADSMHEDMHRERERERERERKKEKGR